MTVLLTVALVATGVYAVVLIAFGIRNKGRGLSTGKAVAAMAGTLAAGLAVLVVVTIGSRTKHGDDVRRLQTETAAAELAFWRRHRRFTAAVRLDLLPLSPRLARLLDDDPSADVRVTELAADGQSVIVRANVGGDFLERIVRAPRRP